MTALLSHAQSTAAAPQRSAASAAARCRSWSWHTIARLLVLLASWQWLDSILLLLFCFFFFQAEDGIRDKLVTGVQTCALPILLVDGRTLIEAESLISGCEHCNRDAEISFDYVLDELTGCDPTRTEYLMYRAGRCPNCRSEVTEKTLITPE